MGHTIKVFHPFSYESRDTDIIHSAASPKLLETVERLREVGTTMQPLLLLTALTVAGATIIRLQVVVADGRLLEAPELMIYVSCIKTWCSTMTVMHRIRRGYGNIRRIAEYAAIESDI
jgi:hypothetical protein